MHDDVIIVGAGPAGSVAATVLARAGVRVRLIDRSTFPRDKLCGDTLNPGALAVLRRLKLNTLTEAQGLPIDGMLVTHRAGVAVESRDPRQLAGRAISRRVLDWSLVEEAVAAGAAFDERTRVHDALFTDRRGSPGICGVRAGPPGRVSSLRAAVTIAADGRRSTLAFRFGLLGHPIRPRRWAVGAYFEGVGGVSSLGKCTFAPAGTSASLPWRTGSRTSAWSRHLLPATLSCARRPRSSTASWPRIRCFGTDLLGPG